MTLPARLSLIFLLSLCLLATFVAATLAKPEARSNNVVTPIQIAKSSGFINVLGQNVRPDASYKSLNFDTYPRTPATASARVLQFPSTTVGSISIYKRAIDERDANAKAANIKAEGTIKIPAGSFVVFRPNERFYKDPSVLDKIPPDGIDALRMQFYTMDDSEEGIGDRALAYLNRLSGLKYINVDRSEISDAGLAGLKDLKEVEQIWAFGTSITGSCFKSMTKMSKLKVLKVPNNGLKEDCTAAIPTSFPNLLALNVNHCTLNDKSIKPLAKCQKLEHLILTENPAITDAAIPYLIPIKTLQKLDLQQTSVTYKGLAMLKAMKNLKELAATADGLTAEQIAMMPRALPDVRVSLAKNKPDRKRVNSDVETIFGPVSRDRKL